MAMFEARLYVAESDSTIMRRTKIMGEVGLKDVVDLMRVNRNGWYRSDQFIGKTLLIETKEIRK